MWIKYTIAQIIAVFAILMGIYLGYIVPVEAVALLCLTVAVILFLAFRRSRREHN